MASYRKVMELVARHGLVQAATDPKRPAYHVPNPAGRRKGVLTDVYENGDGSSGGYIWRTSLPGGWAAAHAFGLTPVGTGDSCYRVADLTDPQLELAMRDAVRFLT